MIDLVALAPISAEQNTGGSRINHPLTIRLIKLSFRPGRPTTSITVIDKPRRAPCPPGGRINRSRSAPTGPAQRGHSIHDTP